MRVEPELQNSRTYENQSTQASSRERLAMRNIVCESPESAGRKAAEWCREKVAAYNVKSIFVPAGRTPLQLYSIWRAERPAYLNKMELVQVDDVLNGEKAGIFKEFFEENLPEYRSQLRFIGQGPAGEQSAVPDLAILGLGLNGHVAFHEPGVDNEFFGGTVALSPTTCEHLGLAAGTLGVTYGAGAFRRSRAILMIVCGASKQDVLKRLLQRDPTLPATSLLGHPDFTLIVDREALGHGPA